MKAAGLDIGSRTIELVVLEDGRLVSWDIIDTGHDPRKTCSDLLDGHGFDALVATGYGRGLAEVQFDTPTVTEIKAHGVGANHLFPGCRTVLDIGGQDTKVISLDGAGRATRFEMNDRCAAGTGRFLEVMAQALRFELQELGPAAAGSTDATKINSMCTVFAESEVVSLVTKGASRQAIARGVHNAIVERTTSILSRVGATDPIVFTGGGALNVCLVAQLDEALKTNLVVPENPQIVGALGAALIAADTAERA